MRLSARAVNRRTPKSNEASDKRAKIDPQTLNMTTGTQTHIDIQSICENPPPSTLHRIITAIGSMVQLRPLPSLPSLGVMTIHKIMLLSLFTLIAVTSASASAIESASNERCETLKTSLTYTQENAPQDISGVVSNIILYCTVLYCTVLYCTLLLIMAYSTVHSSHVTALILILICLTYYLLILQSIHPSIHPSTI